MITILECPICKNQDLHLLSSCQDFTVSHETFDVRLCKNCNLGITTPRPDNEKLGNYYQSEQYVSHSGKTSGGIGTIYKIARNFTLNWKKAILEKQKKTGTLLDFGCGTGEFLNTMKLAGWTVSGVEPTALARTKSEQLTGQKIESELNTTAKFDVVTAWHVIEHVPDFLETISKLKFLLKKGGIIFIAVPNFESPDAIKYKQNWAAFDVPRHLWHFSKSSMKKALHLNGLTIIGTVPMKLDAYYVSLLSEKYKNNNKLSIFTMFHALIAGITSNLKAGSKINHSSLIYIAKVNEN
jgi:2-polyprenyl-3-methyl-5-hydroxy-6-metoxy-1,4-benzoquinol methylase